MKIDVAAVRKCLKSFDFQTLFREHLGWDNHQARLDIPVDGDTVRLSGVAQKRGFVAFVCWCGTGVPPVSDGQDARATIPDRPTRLKIDHQVTKSNREHFVIYADQGTGRQIWHWVRREPGKPLASRDHRFDINQTGDPLIQRLDQIAVSLEEEEDITVVDVVGRARVAFDVDKITKKFYDRFKAEHASFLKLIKGIKAEADLQWYTSLMLNRLMFVYFIQKKGFLDGDTDYLSNRLQMVREARGNDKFQTFYRYFLLRLFHEGLGKSPDERKLDRAMEKLLGKVPFLNGGFFEVHQLEEQNPDIDIPDQAFEKLFAFFDQYRWHLDERPLRADNEINPDVVGYIFEKYINQKQMGAYYTKEDITEYISKNTTIPFLFDAAEKKCPIAFKPESFLWRLLRDDPDRYLYPAVKHGVVCEDGSIVPETELPDFVQIGMHDANARMHDKRYNLQQAPAGDPLRLVTETWREYVYRRTRCLEIREKLNQGEVHRINDLITLNVDIWQFARDAIVTSEGPEQLRALWQVIEKVTVLDPTCGSGAFLFAALRILETLYSDCLERMERFVEEHDSGHGVCVTSRGTVGKSGTGVPPVNHGQDAHATLRIRRGAYLPHWTREGSIYAVTFRLADSLPKSLVEQWAFERDNLVKTASQLGRPLTQDEQKRLKELHSEKVESYLDSGHGACWLKEPRVAEVVASALKHFDGERYQLLGWCVMPNHVHVVVQPRQEHDLPNILHSWKSYTAKEANKILGRKGEFWQSEYYDHLIRDEQDLWHSIEYVVTNPKTAGLKDWRWVGRCLEKHSTEQCDRTERGTGVPPVKHGQDAHATKLRKFSDFRQVLGQIGKHPSERYFILKSIIINNLFGVDIMAEAVEICKLRLFLKLVAQVQMVEQIEPLPDMDFNIRAGNTLVGYATEEEAKKAFTLDSGGQLRTMDGRRVAAYQRFEEDLLILDKTFRQFRAQQTTHGGKVTWKDKQELRRRLQDLDAQLDSYLAAEVKK